MVATKRYPMSAPAGPDFERAPPDPMKRPVPMVPPRIHQTGDSIYSEIVVPMAIICRCLLLRPLESFRLVPACVSTFWLDLPLVLAASITELFSSTFFAPAGVTSNDWSIMKVGCWTFNSKSRNILSNGDRNQE